MKTITIILSTLFMISCYSMTAKDNADIKQDDTGLDSINAEHQNKIKKIENEILSFYIVSKNDFTSSIQGLFSRVKKYSEKLRQSNFTQIDELIALNNEIEKLYGYNYNYSLDVVNENDIINIKNLQNVKSQTMRVNQIEEKLARSLLEIISRPKYSNTGLKIEAFSVNKQNYSNDSIYLKVVTSFYDTTNYTHIKYWFNDPSRNESDTLIHRGDSEIGLKKVKGKHKISGLIKIMEYNKPVWKDWDFEYEVK